MVHMIESQPFQANEVSHSRPACSISRISVCVPTFNYGRFLAWCIESVLARRFTNWELIITDDQSTDQTSEIVSYYAQRDDRIRYSWSMIEDWVFTGNLAHACSLAHSKSSKSSALTIGCIPDCLQECIQRMDECSSTGDRLRKLHQHRRQWRSRLLKYFLPREFYAGAGGHRACSPGASSCRRIDSWHSDYERVGGYDRSLRYVGDYMLGFRMCRIRDFVHIDRALFYGRRRNSSSVVDTRVFVDLVEWCRVPQMLFGEKTPANPHCKLIKHMEGRIVKGYRNYELWASFRGDWRQARACLTILRQNAPVSLIGPVYMVREA